MIYVKWLIRVILSVLGVPFIIALWSFHDYKPVGGDKSIFGHWVEGIKFPILLFLLLSGNLCAHTQNQIVEQKAIETQVQRLRPTPKVTATASPTPDRRATRTPTPKVSPTVTPTARRTP